MWGGKRSWTNTKIVLWWVNASYLTFSLKSLKIGTLLLIFESEKCTVRHFDIFWCMIAVTFDQKNISNRISGKV